jgi:hypothetical protein
MPVIVGGTIIEGGPPQELSGSGAPVNGTNEVQTITIGGTPETASTFPLTYDGWTTGRITWSATLSTLLANILAALVALPNIGASNVTVADGSSSSGVGTFLVTFAVGLGKTDVALMTAGTFLQAAGTASTGTVSVASTTPGVTATGRGAPAGTAYTDITTGVRYVNTGTAAAPTWTAVSDSLGTSYLGSVTPGTVAASKAVVVSAGKLVNEWNVTGLLTVVGAITATTGDVSVAKTDTSATPATERLVLSELTLTPATTLAVAANGSLAAVRGCTTLTTGKSITGGFLYGTQGKLVLDGATVAVGSGHIAGVYGQMSAAGATFTSGHIAPIISCGQSLPAGIADMIYCENNDVTKLHAIIEAIANADFVVDATSEDGNSAYLVGTAGASASKYMRVKLSGTEYRIALLAAA